MADVVNLNRFRKRKQREADRREAEQNRVVHGRSKADKRALQAERARAERVLAGHERGESRTEGPSPSAVEGGGQAVAASDAVTPDHGQTPSEDETPGG